MGDPAIRRRHRIVHGCHLHTTTGKEAILFDPTGPKQTTEGRAGWYNKIRVFKPWPTEECPIRSFDTDATKKNYEHPEPFADLGPLA